MQALEVLEALVLEGSQTLDVRDKDAVSGISAMATLLYLHGGFMPIFPVS